MGDGRLTHPVGGDADSDTTGSSLEGQDLGTPDPWYDVDGRAED